VRKLVVVSNRGPYRVRGSGARKKLVRAAGGLVTALDPVLRARGGVWVSAQETDFPLVVEVEEEAGYALGQVELEKKVRDEFYGPVSNGVLWPVLHSMPSTVDLWRVPFGSYERANDAFALAAIAEGGPDAVYWIHDYHLMQVPARIREREPGATIGWFCHIPWPGPDLFAALPWRDALLEGLLGADLLGFHTERYAVEFLRCVADLTEHEVDLEARTVRVGERTVRVLVAPIGVPFAELEALAGSDSVTERAREIERLTLGRKMILGVDRLDYTKGIPERLRAFERLLRKKPALRRKVLLVQVMVPSREAVKAYRELKDEVDRLVGRINGEFSETGRVPVHYYYRSLGPEELYAHYRAARVALVTPLRDGMNLVSHEYCASRLGEDGVLVLSEFAGASQYLEDALTVNPHDVEGTTDALVEALQMPRDEQQRRMRSLRTKVEELDVHRWAERYLEVLEQ